MDWNVIVTSAAVGAFTSSCVNFISQYLERSSRKKEILLTKAVELAIAHTETVLKIAKETKCSATVPDQIITAAEYYQWLSNLLAKGNLPNKVIEMHSESEMKARQLMNV